MLPPEQILAGCMFAGMIAFLFAGYPVAFSLTFTGLFFGGLGVLSGMLRADFFDILPIRIWGTMTNYTLLSVPLFVFIGAVLPGLLLVALYIIYIAILGRLRPELAPAIPEAELAVFRGDALKRVTIALIPAFALIV